MAVSGFSTRTGCPAGAVWLPFFKTSRGCTSNPPLATTAAACASCSVVTLISCPIDMDGSDALVQRSVFLTFPADSPGSGTPVFCPNPNFRTYRYMFAWPTRRPIWMAPMLLDFASTIAMGMVPYPWCASWMVRPNSVIVPRPQLIMLAGVRSVVSSAAESVITLNTDPGSNGTEIAWFSRRALSSPGCGARFGSYVG